MKKEYVTTHARQYELTMTEVRRAIYDYLDDKGECLGELNQVEINIIDTGAIVSTVDKEDREVKAK